ncbi:MAG: Glycosyl transferase group 1, partial [Candidatus Daviesbacteria bacterium GW2011_GWA1_41_61]
FNKGSIPEIIKDGETGYVVNDVDEMIEAVKKINQIDRAQCRKYALENFSAQKMADSYEQIYWKILQEKKLAVKDRTPAVFVSSSLTH